jgi:hypothetical protein
MNEKAEAVQTVQQLAAGSEIKQLTKIEPFRITVDYVQCISIGRQSTVILNGSITMPRIFQQEAPLQHSPADCDASSVTKKDDSLARFQSSADKLHK